MKKLILTAVLASLAVAYPAVASASTLKGTVVARQASLNVLVVATSSGNARTVHTRNLARGGAIVSVTGTARADGTLTASSVRAAGRASHARFRGVLLRHTAGLSFYSANRSVVAVRSRGRALASANDTTPAAESACRGGFAGCGPRVLGACR